MRRLLGAKVARVLDDIGHDNLLAGHRERPAGTS